MTRIRNFAVFLATVSVLTACDSVQPVDPGSLVLESYLRVDEPLPPVRVSRTYPVSDGLNFPSGEPEANVVLILDGIRIVYEADPAQPGLFLPPAPLSEMRVPPLAAFRIEVDSGEEAAVASGSIPPSIQLDGVDLTIPDRAIEAVLIDTLDIGIDSLDLALNAQEGFIYPIQVQLSWEAPAVSSTNGTEYWIETRLKPVSEFSSSLIDFFLLPQQVLPEANADETESGKRSWSGVYAVPVETADTPVPEHLLTVSLLRGEQTFAVFETSRENPERREPVSNVVGGIGFVGGIAIDTLRIRVE